MPGIIYNCSCGEKILIYHRPGLYKFITKTDKYRLLMTPAEEWDKTLKKESENLDSGGKKEDFRNCKNEARAKGMSFLDSRDCEAICPVCQFPFKISLTRH